MDTDINILPLLATEAVVLVYVLKRAGLVLVPTGVLAFIMFYQVVFYLVHEGFLDAIMLATYSIGGIYDRYNFTLEWYAGLFAFFAFFGRNLRLPKVDNSDQAKLAGMIERWLPKINQYWLIVVAAEFLLLTISLKWSVVWSNETYLMMTDPAKVLAINAPPFRIALLVLLPVGILCAALSALNLGQRSGRFTAIYTTAWLIVMIYYMGSHQRSSVLIPAIFAVIYIALSERPKKTIVAGALLLAAVAFPLALIGRNYATQGISSIFETFETVAQIDDWRFLVSALVTNFGEGIFAFAESIDYPATFSQQYQLLSFSPFPSFIDGYASIRDQSLVMLNDWTPMSGFAEAIKFGPLFVGALAVYFILAMRLNQAVAVRNRLAFILINTFIFLSFFILNAYPARNGLKFTFVAIFAACATLYFTRKPAADAGATQDNTSAL